MVATDEASVANARPAEAARAKRSLTLPLKLGIAWWSLTFGLYLLKWPVDYQPRNLGLVALLWAASMLAFAIGYLTKARWSRTRAPVGPLAEIPISRAAWVGLLISVLLLPAIVRAYSGFALSDIRLAVADQQLAYRSALEQTFRGTQTRLGLVLLLSMVSPLTMLALPYFSFAWFAYRRYAIAFLVAAIIPIAQSAFLGRDQQLGVLAAILLSTALLASARRRRPIRFRNIFIGAAGLSLLLAAFVERRLARSEGSLDTCFQGASCGGGHRALSDAVYYVTHGFQGLGVALDARWSFGGGFSHSPAFTNILVGSFNFKEPMTVTSQLDGLGWSSTTLWSTGLTGLANDLPWVLVPFVILGLGWLLAASFESGLATSSPLAISVFCYTFLTVLFMPMNLQIAYSGPLNIGYVVLCCIFLLRRRPP